VSTLDIDGLGSWYTVDVPGMSPPAVYGHSATLIGSKVTLPPTPNPYPYPYPYP
jgi:hypothetical protein